MRCTPIDNNLPAEKVRQIVHDEALLRQALTRLNLSPRAYHRILRVARSIADLAGAAELNTRHIAEAIQYRRLAKE